MRDSIVQPVNLWEFSNQVENSPSYLTLLLRQQVKTCEARTTACMFRFFLDSEEGTLPEKPGAFVPSDSRPVGKVDAYRPYMLWVKLKDGLSAFGVAGYLEDKDRRGYQWVIYTLDPRGRIDTYTATPGDVMIIMTTKDIFDD